MREAIREFTIPPDCDDEEIEAMYVIKQLLDPLEREARDRVLTWYVQHDNAMRRKRLAHPEGGGAADEER